jgi:hypothetical protein
LLPTIRNMSRSCTYFFFNSMDLCMLYSVLFVTVLTSQSSTIYNEQSLVDTYLFELIHVSFLSFFPFTFLSSLVGSEKERGPLPTISLKFAKHQLLSSIFWRN